MTGRKHNKDALSQCLFQFHYLLERVGLLTLVQSENYSVFPVSQAPLEP